MQDNETPEVAVALTYKPKREIAPQIVAKGKGFLARKILEIARQFKVPVFFNRKLARLLYQLPLNSLIPESLYGVVAEVLAWVYSIDKRRAEVLKT